MDISKLEPGPELDALVAEKVMGWTHGLMAWSPSTDIAAAWQVEEKIAEFWRLMLPYTDALKHLCKVSENDVPMTFDLVHASPLLRCQAALLAMTYLERKRS